VPWSVAETRVIRSETFPVLGDGALVIRFACDVLAAAVQTAPA
jgi:hypothetical protein